MNVDDLSNVCCQSCEIYDASLRCSSHPSVVSLIVTSNQSSHVGIFCARCRAIESAKAMAISLLAGWWSLQGPALTIAAVRANAQGGEQSASANAQLLRGLARLQFDKGNPEFASMFARAAHAVQPQRENTRLLDELNRKGQRATAPESMWRLVPFAPLVLFVFLVGFIGVRVVSRIHSATPETPAQQIAAAAVPAAHMPTPSPASAPVREDLNGTADDLEKRLTPDSSPRLAKAYIRARLSEMRGQIAPRVRHGDDLLAMEMKIRAMNEQPATAAALGPPGARTAYDHLTETMAEATRYYHGGAAVETIERTLGESLDTTAIIAYVAIDNEVRGNTSRADALGNVVDQRMEGMVEMKRDLYIRAAVISTTTKAIDECLKSVRD